LWVGDNPVYSDADSSSSEDGSDTGDDTEDGESISGISDASIALALDGAGSGLMEDSEFRIEVTQSLERAFAEGHSVDNAAVELKTLRMASNVPLSRVKEAVVAAIVEKIQVKEGDVPGQRREIAGVVGRWGELINKIGGVDPVETVSILQVRTYFCVSVCSVILLMLFSRPTARRRLECRYLDKSSRLSIRRILLRKIIFASGMLNPPLKAKIVNRASRRTTSKNAG